MSEIDMSTYEGVRLSKNGPVLTATITNPSKKNAVNRPIMDDLARLWRQVDDDETVRVVIFTGEGNAFCSGVDLSNLAANSGAERPPSSKGAAKDIRDRIFDILDCETPVISKVRGPAYGMGVNLCLAADFVIAEHTARFCDSHVKNGIAAGDGGVPLFPALIGFRRAKEMLMLGEPISGKEAAEIGLINRSVEPEDLDRVVDEWALKIAEAAPLALTYTKLSLNTMLKQQTLGAFETSIAYDLLTLKTNDVREGSSAFVEKRKPKFTGS